MSDEILGFKIDIPQAELDDLKQRLHNARLPDKETVNDWSQGIPHDIVKTLQDHWLNDYDWSVCQKRLNSYSQFTTNINDL